jgi:hypothetical protein
LRKVFNRQTNGQTEIQPLFKTSVYYTLLIEILIWIIYLVDVFDHTIDSN